MVIRGALKKDQFGFSMPANAPLYPRPPYVYQNATLMIFKYVTDAKTAAQLILRPLSSPTHRPPVWSSPRIR
jgi:acetoacetate decarboxylase